MIKTVEAVLTDDEPKVDRQGRKILEVRIRGQYAKVKIRPVPRTLE